MFTRWPTGHQTRRPRVPSDTKERARDIALGVEGVAVPPRVPRGVDPRADAPHRAAEETGPDQGEEPGPEGDRPPSRRIQEARGGRRRQEPPRSRPER